MSTNARLFNPTGGASYAPVAAAAADRPAAPWVLHSLSEAFMPGGREYFLWGADGSHLDLHLDLRWRRGPAAHPTRLLVAVHCGHW